jgi:hypothetical protein
MIAMVPNTMDMKAPAIRREMSAGALRSTSAATPVSAEA